MTKDEILKIKEHIEIHARREPRAIKITEILWKAVDELKHISELEQENAELKAQNEKMKSQYDYAFNQLCKSREILCSMLSQYRDRKEIDYSTRECGEKLLKEGVCKNG